MISLQMLFKISFVNLHDKFETICTDSKMSSCIFPSLDDASTFFCFCRKIFLRSTSDISNVEIWFESLSTVEIGLESFMTWLFGLVAETMSCQEISGMRSFSWWIDSRNKDVCCSRDTNLDVSSITFLTVPFFSNDFGSLSRSGSWSMLWWDEISEKMLHEFFIKFFSGFVAADETGLLVLAECLDGVSGGFCRSGSGMLSQLSTYVKLHLILLHLQLTILERKFYLRKFGSIRRRLRDNEL